MQEIIINFVKQNAATLAWIVVLFLFGKTLLNLAVNKILKMMDSKYAKTKIKDQKRVATIAKIFISSGNVIIYIIILFMVLNVSGVNITPILTGAGIFGLAISFGSQSLVKDFVTGFFILIENQFGIGDKVKISNLEGEVVRITMRSTVLKDEKNNIYYIANGSINNVINESQQAEKIQKN